MDLQYLPEDKKRDDDPDIRKMLLETLLLVQTLATHIHTHRLHVFMLSSSLVLLCS